jgi:protein-tyrosine phosphatase
MKILFVCTGNICRSPMAAQMLLQMLETAAPKAEVLVSSAGTGALEGHPLDPKAGLALNHLGFAHLTHKATQLTQELVANANLILTSTLEQRGQVVELLVKANRYTFTLKEFGHLAEYELANRSAEAEIDLPTRLAETISLRGFASLDEDQEIADPYRKDQVHFDAAAQQTQFALKQVVAWLQ